MKKHFLIFIIVLLPYHHNTWYTMTMSVLNWNQLDDYLNKKVQIKGFLYQSDQTLWFLTTQPHLKTCCILNKELPIIFIEGMEFPKKKLNTVISLTGELTYNMDHYTLKNIEYNNQKQFLMPYISLGVIGITIFYLLRKKLN